MFSETTIYERTVKGHEEIRDKTHVLTQGERLILVDGITPYRHLGQKLKGLAEWRLNRALLSLLTRNLIIEVDASMAIPPAEKLASVTVDRFLQQDPLDPVTITLLEQADGVVVAKVVGAAHESEDASLLPVIDPPERRRMATVDFYLPLQQVADPDVPGLKFNPAAEGWLHTASSRDEGRRRGDSAGRRRREAQSRRVQLGYWLFFIGLTAAMLYVIVQSS